MLLSCCRCHPFQLFQMRRRQKMYLLLLWLLLILPFLFIVSFVSPLVVLEAEWLFWLVLHYNNSVFLNTKYLIRKWSSNGWSVLTCSHCGTKTFFLVFFSRQGIQLLRDCEFYIYTLCVTEFFAPDIFMFIDIQG